jgi:diguanylate cyclase (GGDEF)-like protein
LMRRNEGVGMSIGVASVQTDSPRDTDQLIAAADAALYGAKAAGRNRVMVSRAGVPHQ